MVTFTLKFDLTPWMRLLRQLVVARSVKKFPVFVEPASLFYVHNSTTLDTNQSYI